MESTDPIRLNQEPEEEAFEIAGELVLQNGRQAGTRRPLGVPTTFIGRSPGCDIRLNIDGVDAMHCVLVVAADGLHVRDLNSAHGTYVNGERIATTLIRHGDLLKIGPFQFRLEMAASGVVHRHGNTPDPGSDVRDAIQIQVAAVVAQQISLEEEEARLCQRQSDMQQQEEQLAAHLFEKQQQVQMWTDHTKAERTALRQQKVEQHKALTQLERELNEAKEGLGEEQQRLNQDRDRINKVYQRLRSRWQRQWSAEKEKYRHLFARLEIGTKTLAARQAELSEQEARLAQETRRFNTEREASARQLQEGGEELKKAQVSWRRRHTQERILWKAREQEVEQAVAKMTEARQILQQEREAWKKQQDAMQKELHGLNNRVVHQREKIKEQEDRMTALDAELRTRLLHMRRVTDIESAAGEDPNATGSKCAEVSSATEGEPAAPPAARELSNAELAEEVARIEALDQLAGELADQRVHLVEQYKRLAEIQELWSLQREQAADELEAVAQKLHAQEQTLAQREQQTSGAEQSLKQEHEEIQAVRQEIQLWRARLKAREQAVDQEHQHRLLALQQQETLLQEQLGGLTQLRQRWNRRRQEEIEYVRSEQARLKEQREEASRLRQELFNKGQALDEEKRIVAEKALAVELYRQEVARKANDPAAERRIERLRRRWLMQNTVLIRDAKRERENVKVELAQLETRCDDWLKQMEAVTQADAILAEKLSVLEEREALLKAREHQLDQENQQHDAQRHQAEEKLQLMKDEVERMAQDVYEEAETTPEWTADKAA